MRTHQQLIHGWPGLRLEASEVSVGLAPDIGGRILSLMFQGHELLYVHESEAGHCFDFPASVDIRTLKKDFGFRLFGGDKTWVAPENEWLLSSPPIELDAGRYALEEKDGWYTMTSPACRETGLRIIRRVRLKDDGIVCLEEEFENLTGRPLCKGIWNVTQIPRPFDVYIPADFSAIRSYHLEDPTLPDSGQTVESVGDWVKISCRSAACFKFGGIPREGRVIAAKPFADGAVIFAREFDCDIAAAYAHRSAVEVFNSSRFNYGEIEFHAPLRVIPPGGRVRFAQTWRLAVVPGDYSIDSAARVIFPS